MKSYLKTTVVRLVDGEDYVFSTLPFNKATISLFKTITSPDSNVSEFEKVEAMHEAIYTSLGCSGMSREKVDELFNTGVIPFPSNLESKDGVWKKIMEALFIQGNT